MNRWPRRLLYILLIVLWLLVMSFPVVAVVLATQEQIQIGSDPQTHLRLFLLQERDVQGVGIEWTRRQDAGCAQTSLVYLLWEGEGENSSYCQCYGPDGGLTESYAGSCSAS